ncbi:TetR family transcriptional regulator [Desulfovibrio sp. OttesenSCG-928-A18]|nr:TetR family transcriptional regulator [Desulfovibrio sp. OttesenSCG-928-A18]
MKGKKRERLAAFNRANILEAAHKLFLEKGIPGTTMDDISKEAGCSKTTIYSYFESKEDVVNHLFFEGVSVFQEAVREEAEKSRNLKEFYNLFCTSLVAMHKEQPIYYEGVAGEAVFDKNAPPESIVNKIYTSGEVSNATIEECIKKAIAAKEISINGDVFETMTLLWFCIMGIVEKSALKESYVKFKLGKTREEFLEYAFNKLFTLLERR